MNMDRYHKCRQILIGLLLVFTVAGFSACNTLGIPSPQSTEQSIAYMYPTIGTVATETTRLLKAGKITKAEGQNILAILDNAKAATDIAQQYVRNKDNEKAAASIQLARSVLEQAQKFLASRGS